jgi:hypothetical protein
MTDSHDAPMTAPDSDVVMVSWGGVKRGAIPIATPWLNGFACPELEIVVDTRSGGIGTGA